MKKSEPTPTRPRRPRRANPDLPPPPPRRKLLLRCTATELATLDSIAALLGVRYRSALLRIGLEHWFALGPSPTPANGRRRVFAPTERSSGAVNVRLTEAEYHRLGEQARRLGVHGRAEVIRIALEHYLATAATEAAENVAARAGGEGGRWFRG